VAILVIHQGAAKPCSGSGSESDSIQIPTVTNCEYRRRPKGYFIKEITVKPTIDKSAASFNGDIPLTAQKVFATLASPLKPPKRSLAHLVFTSWIRKTKLEVSVEWPNPNSITKRPGGVGISPTLAHFQRHQGWSGQPELHVTEAVFRMKVPFAPQHGQTRKNQLIIDGKS
jgi:hypothetical protein